MMKRIRNEEWKKNQSQEDLDDLDKVWKPSEVLPEDCTAQASTIPNLLVTLSFMKVTFCMHAYMERI